jgi:hypothetical protein
VVNAYGKMEMASGSRTEESLGMYSFTENMKCNVITYIIFSCMYRAWS